MKHFRLHIIKKRFEKILIISGHLYPWSNTFHNADNNNDAKKNYHANYCSNKYRIYHLTIETFAGHQRATYQAKNSQDRTPGLFFHAAFDFDAAGPRNASQNSKITENRIHKKVGFQN